MKNPRQEWRFQLVVDNPDLTGLKAGFDHIQPLYWTRRGRPPAQSRRSQRFTPRWGRFFWGRHFPVLARIRPNREIKAVDVLRRTCRPMTATQIANALVADKAPKATRKAGHRPTGGYPCCPAEA